MSARQAFPALDSATEAALRESIRRFGVIVPVVIDQNGEIVDGHHRSRLAGELGVDYPTDVRSVSDEEEALEIARTLNSDRRHMPAPQRKEVVVALREQGHSTRAIAGAVGVTPKTIRQDLAGGEYSPPRRVVDGLSMIGGLCTGLSDVDYGQAAVAFAEEETKTWAKKARALSSELRRVADALEGVAANG